MPVAKRKAIAKSLRFEVFKRDNFTCQYCGYSAPGVVLQIDHIKPVSKGGSNELLNLITSCANCNAGKSDHRLDDDSTLAKQRQQLAELNERREQLSMMLEWRKGLNSIKETEIDAIASHWRELLGGQYSLNQTGLQQMKKLVRKFGVSAVMDAMEAAVDSYVEEDVEGKYVLGSVEKAYQKVGGFCAMSSMPEDGRKLYYIRAIARNRLPYCDSNLALRWLKNAAGCGVPVDELERVTKDASSWTEWKHLIDDLIGEYS
jgi:hypothetical protein